MGGKGVINREEFTDILRTPSSRYMNTGTAGVHHFGVESNRRTEGGPKTVVGRKEFYCDEDSR